MWANLASPLFPVFLLLPSLPTEVSRTRVNKDYFTSQAPTQPSTLACQRKMFDYKHQESCSTLPKCTARQCRAEKVSCAWQGRCRMDREQHLLEFQGAELCCSYKGRSFEQHPLESLFLCRIIGSTFWTLCCGYKQSPLLFSKENIKPMAQLWFLCVLVSWSPKRSVSALFLCSLWRAQLGSGLPVPWIAGHEEKQALKVQTPEGFSALLPKSL